MNNVRETGVVVAVKDAFGFIRCAEREDKLFFHFSSLMNPSPTCAIEAGDEVSFSVRSDPESGRLSAVQVLVLPPGTVVFEEVSEIRSRGVIERELQYLTGPNGATPTEPFGGRIHAEVEDVPGISSGEIVNGAKGPYALLEFSGRDIDDPQNILSLSPGDIVEFQLFTEKRSGRQGATNIRLIQKGNGLPDASNETERETGIIVAVKESYGFIRCLDRDQKQMFFHFSEVADPGPGIQPGAEVSFIVGTNKKNQVHATRVKILEPGTIMHQKIDSTPRRGIVSVGISAVKGPKSKRNSTGSHEFGNIEYVDEERSRPEPQAMSSQSAPVSRLTSPLNMPGAVTRTLSFSNVDLADPRFELLPGDEVEFKIAVHNRTRTTSATGVTLLVPSPIGRERGIVTVLKQQYGFIKCESRPDPLFFHFSEVLDPNVTIQVGSEVEFNINYGKEQLSASRLALLPAGSVLCNTIDLQGTIVQEPGARSSNSFWGKTEEQERHQLQQQQHQQQQPNQQPQAIPAGSSANDVIMGIVKLTEESMLKANLLTDLWSFGPNDLLVGRTALRPGDKVEFGFRLTDAADDLFRISLLRLMPKKGFVESTYPNGGFIRIGDESVVYSQNDVNRGVVLHLNDEVLVNNLTYNSRKRQRVARSIERIKAAPVSTNEEALLKKIEQLSTAPQRPSNSNRVKQITRMAAGPDGTIGFKPGSRSGL